LKEGSFQFSVFSFQIKADVFVLANLLLLKPVGSVLENLPISPTGKSRR
jgi:hypothetical protein